MRIRRVARHLHRGLNLLLILGVIVQFYAAGWAAFGMPFTFHAVLGWILLAASIPLTLLAAIGYGRSRTTLLAVLLAATLTMQPVFVFVLSAVSIAITALHPVNGLLALYLAVETERGIRRAGTESNVRRSVTMRGEARA